MTEKIKRTDVEFEVDGGVKLRGWLFVPPGEGRRPAITMAHGYAGVREHGIEPFARAFAEAGFVVLLHDHRGFGASEGTPRHDIDPWRQVADWRRAISFLESLKVVDPARIGLWGTSYAGGHAIVLGATERRLRCVVAQVPTISGYEQGAAFRRKASGPSRKRSPPTIAPSCAASRLAVRRSSAPIPRLPRPIARRTRSTSICSRCRTACGKTM
jgi:cephalosporin-C deacetylase-like acetyl esterase